MIETNFLRDKIPKENVYFACIVCITIDSVMKMKKKLSTSLFRRKQIQSKENKDV